jgi:uncharacterized membrane protein
VEHIQEFAKFLATFCCALFSGAAIYVNLVEHPARMECGTEIAVKEFGPSYRRATIMQVVLAVIGCVVAILVWLMGESIWWLIGGVSFGSVIPFTLIVIFPVNKRLLAPTLDMTSTEARYLLSRWNKLHAVRSILSLVALIIFLWSYK